MTTLYQSIIYISSLLASIVLAVIVFISNRTSKVNRIFTLCILSISGWILTLYLFYSGSRDFVLYFGKLNFVSVELIAYFAFIFGYWFPERTFKIKKIYFILLTIWLVVLTSLTMFTNLIDKDEIITDTGIETVFGDFYFLFIIHFLVLTSTFIVFPLLKYRKVNSLFRYQIKYLTIGASLTMICASITNIFLPFFFSYYDAQPLGPLFSFFLIGFTAYAIIRHRLMDIRLAIKNSTIYFFSLLSSLLLSTFLMFFFIQNQDLIPINSNMASVITLTFGILIFSPIQELFKQLGNRYLFYSLYNAQQTIRKTADSLNTMIDLDKIIDSIIRTMMDTMKLERAGVLLVEKVDGETIYQIQKVVGFNEDNGISLVKNNFLTQYLEINKKALVREELEHIASEAHDNYIRKMAFDLKKHMEKIEASLCLPLVSKNKLTGLICLGNKISQDAYTVEDIELLETLASQASIAIENARLYEQTKNFNIELQRKVEKATKELKETNRQLAKANVRLKELDELKSEFISIASHQLRTPLSVIKGYISMIVNENYGEVKEEQKKILRDIIYVSVERLNQLVDSLLDLARMEKKGLSLDEKKTDLVNIAERVVKEQKINAIQKGLGLTFEKQGKEDIPKIKVDSQKIRDAIMNLIDNAIKYTEKGFITVKILLNSDNEIQIDVQDTGRGLSQENIDNLFAKFTRVDSSHKLNTEGTGLGLYIVKRIIEAHGGKVWVTSEGRGKGAVFSFSLPIEKK